MRHRHWGTKSCLPPDRRGDEQIVGRQPKANAEFFQRENRRRGLASGNITEIPGTEMASFGSGFVAEFAGIAELEYRGR